MEIFLDTANIKEIERWVQTGIIDGVTTNPSLLRKQGGNIRQLLVDICNLVDGDVSIEVVEKEPEAVYRQAMEIATLAENVVVKIPFCFEYLSVIDRLTDEEIDLNITLVFTALQALMVAKLGVAYISPFVGRLDDIGQTGVDLIEDIIEIRDNYDDFDAEILAASIRSVDHWKQVVLLGVDVVTLPPSILQKALYHPLTDKGIAQFDADWAATGEENLLK